MSQKPGSWSNEDTRPMRPVRLDDTQPIKRVSVGFGLDQVEKPSKWHPIFRLLRLLLACGFAALIFLIVYLMLNGTKSVPFIDDAVSSFRSGPSDAAALKIIEAKQGWLWSDFKIISKNQCPLSAQSKANGIEEAWMVFFSYKQKDYASNSQFLFIRTTVNPEWATSDWYVVCP